MDRRLFLKSGAAIGGAFGMDRLLFSFADGALCADETMAAESGKMEAPKFIKAEPVWAAGREKEMNMTLSFIASFEIPSESKFDDWILRFTGSTIARILVNGKLAGYGPARGPHGWYRVDEWKIGGALKTGANIVLIEIAGYNSNSYYLLDQPSFLQAEILDGENRPIAATSADSSDAAKATAGFDVIDETGIRVQKVQRFSFQRPFIEVYDFRHQPPASVQLARQPEVKYLPRRVPYPEFTRIEPAAWLKTGTVSPRKVEQPWRDRSLVNIGPQLKGYKLDELSVVLSDRMQSLETKLTDDAPKALGATFKAGDVQVVDFGANDCGFFELNVDALEEGTELAVTFDEILNDGGDVDFLRLGTCSAILWTFSKQSDIPVLAFEPQVGRYAKIHCLKGSFTLRDFAMREYAYPKTSDALFKASDAKLEKLFQAAALTFRCNALDVFMDCPSRERAGWLCDSFFTSRVAFDLTGKTDVERAFFENFMLPENFEFLPDGMLPMCYPADHNDGIYIPNWALWFVMELGEYARRTTDCSILDGLHGRVEKLMAFFAGYENADGLLEKLPSWVFVEWSAANSFVQDVNYPSNMLYAAALETAGRLYRNAAWQKKAEAIRKTIVAQSYDGEFFVDNALRKPDGKLELTKNRSEVCQYFAFFFRTATPESHPALWNILLDEFGPDRAKKGIRPEIHKANSFVGNVLRLELLSWADRSEQLFEESLAYNEYMADRTGTLWENDGAYASCSHGFASHLAHLLYRDVLGIADVDPAAGTVTVRFRKFDRLDSAEGERPVPGGVVKLAWKKEGGKLLYSLDVPEKYRVVVENGSTLEAVRS